ncbi:metal ABC transporter permease [Candidatus Giovannonibacteria bacterium]|nr:metal ABC transporter permease [Candidatus Giovannonibacteria bacterium]
METSLLYTLIAGSAIAAAGGLVGSFALLRRMALVGDALSHVALPGIALGLLLHFNPFIGAFAFLLLGVLIIWAVEHKTKLPVEALVGVVFTLALSVGALLATQEEILEALFGDITKLSRLDFVLAILSSAFIISLVVIYYKKFSLTMMSPDLALSIGYKPHLLELLFLTIFALAVAAGIKFTGALLMGSLIIIPAATARNLAGSMKSYLWLSAFLGVLEAVFGMLAAKYYGLSPGPVFVIFAGIFFFVSVFLKEK